MNAYNRLLLHRLADIFGYFFLFSFFFSFSFFVSFFHNLFFIGYPDFVGRNFMLIIRYHYVAPSSLFKFEEFLLLFYCNRFSHQSVGEGDDRHLILECCPETSMYVKIGALGPANNFSHYFFSTCSLSVYALCCQYYAYGILTDHIHTSMCRLAGVSHQYSHTSRPNIIHHEPCQPQVNHIVECAISVIWTCHNRQTG